MKDVIEKAEEEIDNLEDATMSIIEKIEDFVKG